MTTEIAMPRDSAATVFPDVKFATVEIMGEMAVSFSLRNPEDHIKAKRAVESAIKLLTDAGAKVEANFEEPK